jgi:hypothetical protein
MRLPPGTSANLCLGGRSAADGERRLTTSQLPSRAAQRIGGGRAKHGPAEAENKRVAQRASSEAFSGYPSVSESELGGGRWCVLRN